MRQLGPGRDLEALMAGFADDAVWITGKTTARGRAELADLFTGAMRGLLPTLAIQNLIAGEGQAAARIYREGSADVAAAAKGAR
jgi:hypothetical protein